MTKDTNRLRHYTRYTQYIECLYTNMSVSNCKIYCDMIISVASTAASPRSVQVSSVFEKFSINFDIFNTPCREQ